MSSINNSSSAFEETEIFKPYHDLQQLEDKLSEAHAGRTIKSIAIVESRLHSGPLPDPETLSKYCEVIPNGAERIMQMLEKQQEHRLELERAVIGQQVNQNNRGQLFAFIIAITSILVAAYCVLQGQRWGAILGVGGLTGLVSVFIQGKKQQRKSLNSK